MNRLSANRGLLQIFFSLLLVIVIMFISNYVVYKNSISGIYEKVTQNNRLVIQNIIQSFDSSFTSINNLIFSIHGMPYDSLTSSEDGSIDMAKVYLFQDNIANLVSSMDFIEDVIVFYDHVDLAITANGTSDMEALFNVKYRNEIHNADYWRTFAGSKHPFTVFPAEDYSVSTDGLNHRTKRLMVAMDGNKVRLSNKNVIVLIDVDKLLKQVNLKTMIPGASLIVLDASRNVILSTEKNLDLMEVLSDVYFNNNREASLTRGDFEYDFFKSDYNGYIYINKMPYQFQNIDSVTTANHTIMISGIVSAVILAALLSIYLYKPVKDILKLLGGGSSRGNDFRKIFSGILKIQTENETMKQQIAHADTEICRGIFLQSLDEHAHSRRFEQQMQIYYPYFFRTPQFVMAAVQLKRKPEKREEAGQTVEEIAGLLQSGLRRGVPYAVVFHADNLKFLALIGVEQPAGRKDAVGFIRTFLAGAGTEELKSFSLRASVSRVYDSDIRNCHAAYRDTVEGLLYRGIHHAETVIDAESVPFTSEIHFPFEKIEKLAICLISGREAEGIRMIDEILSENRERHIPHHRMTHIAKSIFFHMLKQIGTGPDGAGALERLEKEFCRKIENAYDEMEIREELVAAYKHLANMNGREPKSKLNPDFIAQYIELHYMESLYLDHMAGVLETSPKYFSNYFKKTFGINYVEHLNKVRLSHAKEFLKNTELSISEIGEKTGYLNSSTFTTTFKKYYGISPSEYRKKID